MNCKQAKKLFNYFCDSVSEVSPYTYIIHWINENGEIFNLINMEYILSAYRFTFEFGEESFTLWEEEIDESQMFVFKQINWNKL